MAHVSEEIIRIRKCWQSGSTLSQAFQRLNQRYGFEDKSLLIQQWRIMKKKFGCQSLPWGYVNGLSTVVREPSESELNQPVTPPMYGTTYGNWKGLTGPGKQLREMLQTA